MYNIYAHLDGNEIVYIGKGLDKRITCFNLKNPTYSQVWLNYFKNKTPIVKILIENLTEDEANLQEWLAIQDLRPLLNKKSGGPNGRLFEKKDMA